MAEPGVQVSRQELLEAGVGAERAARLVERAGELLAGGSPSGDRSAAEHCWSELSRSLLTPEVPFDAHRLLHERIFSDRDPAAGPAPAWLPSAAEIQASNLQAMMRARGCATYRELFDWSVANRMEFWRIMVERLESGSRSPTPPSPTWRTCAPRAGSPAPASTSPKAASPRRRRHRRSSTSPRAVPWRP